MRLTGKIKLLKPVQTFDSGFKKSEVVITTDDQYPQFILIEFLGDSSELPQSYKEGDSVNIHINIRGREWISPQGETKYFNSITGWRIEKSTEGGAPKIEPSYQMPPTITKEHRDEDDDLPF